MRRVGDESESDEDLGPTPPWLQQLVAQMQTADAAAATEAFFKADSEELGEAAVRAAQQGKRNDRGP